MTLSFDDAEASRCMVVDPQRCPKTSPSICMDPEEFEADQQSSERTWAISNVVMGLAILAFFVLALLTAIGLSWGWENKKQRQTKSVKIVTWIVIAIVIFLLISTVLGLIVITVIHAVERNRLFAPSQVTKYRKVSGKWFPLPSGGGLLHVTPDASPQARVCVFVHGNSLNLDAYASAMERFKALGYNLWAVEYGGFGIAEGVSDSPSAETVLQDMREAWAICGRSDAVLIGFSIGGAVVGQVYDELMPSPAQIVFVNTFASFSELCLEKLGWIGNLLVPLLHTKWDVKRPKNYCGRVVVVFTADDTLIPPHHGSELCAIFASLKPQCIELPAGGHKFSAFQYMSSWTESDVLLPP